MKKYKVAFIYEEEVEATDRLADYYGGSSYPKENKANQKHTEYFTDPAKEII